MKQHLVKPGAWTKPEIRRLGEIKDVAGPSGVGTQGGPNGKS
jgi:hypothetical protein